MDYLGPAPLGSQAALLSLPVSKPVTELHEVCPSCQTDSTGADARNRPDQDQTAAARDIAALAREAQQDGAPAGPPPAFKVSLLEMESDLKHVLARIEAARAKARDADALRVEADTAEAQAQAEADGIQNTIAASGGSEAVDMAEAAAPVLPGTAIPAAAPTPLTETAA